MKNVAKIAYYDKKRPKTAENLHKKPKKAAGFWAVMRVFTMKYMKLIKKAWNQIVDYRWQTVGSAPRPTDFYGGRLLLFYFHFCINICCWCTLIYK